LDPRVFQFEVSPEGLARPGLGIIAAYVPAAMGWPAMVALASDPYHDPGRPIKDMAPAAIQFVLAGIEEPAETLRWTVIDAVGRFTVAVPKWPNVGSGSGTSGLPEVSYERFPTGLGVEAFLKETGATGEVALEMLSAASETLRPEEDSPSMQEFLDAVEAHSNLPVPNALFHMVEDAVSKGDIKRVTAVIQSDPVISLSLINYANAARFIGADKTASVRQAVVRLGMVFVQRVVFVAAMMMRYQKGRCPEFNYSAYWMNALATGAAMRALLPDYGIPDSMADDAHAIGLVSNIGWLAVAETYPALMAKYLQRCRGKDPLPKIRLQNDIFPCPIRLVSERYLQRFSFPDVVHSTIAGKSAGHHNLGECLARATRVAQSLAPLNLLAVLPMTQVPPACREEWDHWQTLLKSVKR
jgi:HD-like signal output (HDOD) protein